ncbi:MAG: hypothetical protein KGN00_00270 [Chloroflexota bacterium]|nr:hypothetical protein [Chloroflexota bacterium]MDE3192097.1 hypothetical protein [Chloroflexota bacterium]
MTDPQLAYFCVAAAAGLLAFVLWDTWDTAPRHDSCPITCPHRQLPQRVDRARRSR